MSRSFHARAQWAYSAVLTLVLGVFLFTGMAPRRATFEEIDVQRINVREPDGTIRLVLSSEDRFPGLILRGEEYPHPNRRTAGILFFNDDGSEHGGLVFGGSTDADGNVTAYGHLSFDRFEQDQVITFSANESGDLQKAGISVWDRPDYSMVEVAELMRRTNDLPADAGRDSLNAFFARQERAHPRMYLGKSQNGSVSLRLNDRSGRERLVLEVTPEGSPILRMLDEDGTELARFPETDEG